MDRGLTQRLEAAATLEEPGRLFGRKCRCSVRADSLHLADSSSVRSSLCFKWDVRFHGLDPMACDRELGRWMTGDVCVGHPPRQWTTRVSQARQRVGSRDSSPTFYVHDLPSPNPGLRRLWRMTQILIRTSSMSYRKWYGNRSRLHRRSPLRSKWKNLGLSVAFFSPIRNSAKKSSSSLLEMAS